MSVHFVCFLHASRRRVCSFVLLWFSGLKDEDSASKGVNLTVYCGSFEKMFPGGHGALLRPGEHRVHQPEPHHRVPAEGELAVPRIHGTGRSAITQGIWKFLT